MDVQVIQVIKTRLTLAGKGTNGSPLRRVEQYWDMDGNLLWQHDPCADEEHIEILADGTVRPVRKE